MAFGKIRQAVRSRFGFAVAIGMIKNTTIRGHSIAKILSILNEDETINRNPKLLERYTGEIGKERDIVLIEINQGKELIAQYLDTSKESLPAIGFSWRKHWGYPCWFLH
jgi:hypothetical protein